MASGYILTNKPTNKYYVTGLSSSKSSWIQMIYNVWSFHSCKRHIPRSTNNSLTALNKASSYIMWRCQAMHLHRSYLAYVYMYWVWVIGRIRELSSFGITVCYSVLYTHIMHEQICAFLSSLINNDFFKISSVKTIINRIGTSLRNKINCSCNVFKSFNMILYWYLYCH